ncbi:MAG: CPBP family intramembrane metalloprotease [Algicola sp.]|nr:CPBP family intramembrane metalloprotease [Algicola sp.]
MQSIRFKLLEFIGIFILIPLSYILDYPIFIKFSIGCLGFVYVLFVLLRIEHVKFKIAKNLHWRHFFRRVLIQLSVIAFLTVLYVWFMDKSQLFYVMLNKPFFWLLLLLIYSSLSVYPQELVYRTFFFERYKNMFKSQTVFVIVNALVFSLAHLFFKNTLVLIMTFIGGILFALTYLKTKSTVMVSVEHAIYGCWLFTVGMGDMLGFPN